MSTMLSNLILLVFVLGIAHGYEYKISVEPCGHAFSETYDDLEVQVYHPDGVTYDQYWFTETLWGNVGYYEMTISVSERPSGVRFYFPHDDLFCFNSAKWMDLQSSTLYEEVLFENADFWMGQDVFYTHPFYTDTYHLYCSKDCGEDSYLKECWDYYLAGSCESCTFCDGENDGEETVGCGSYENSPGYCVQINECETFDVGCNHGVCVDEINNYHCECDAGFTGEYCDSEIDECEDVACNHGVCVDEVNNYQCVCDAGFTGEHCDSEIDECEDVSCNHGVCVDEVNNYHCECEYGFSGEYCDIENGNLSEDELECMNRCTLTECGLDLHDSGLESVTSEQCSCIETTCLDQFEDSNCGTVVLQQTEWFIENGCFAPEDLEGQFCVRVVTADTELHKNSNGYLTLAIEIDGISVQLYDQHHFDFEEIVLEMCNDSPITLTVSNSHSNSWIGSVRFSEDNGETWDKGTCENCTNKYLDDRFVVDADDGKNGCRNGHQCVLSIQSARRLLSRKANRKL